MKEQRVTFKSESLTLEGLLAKPEGGAPVRGGVVCHPHPLYGGSMYNNVVDAVLNAMWELGWATLRFNFRGVGESEGEHGGGAGEAADAAAAVRFLSSQPGVQPQTTVLAGYSFGAMAAAMAAPEIDGFGALILVALPLKMGNGAAALKNFTKPIVFAAGDHDMCCAAPQLKALHQDLGARSQLKIIAGADHFFGGYEEELANALAVMMRAL